MNYRPPRRPYRQRSLGSKNSSAPSRFPRLIDESNLRHGDEITKIKDAVSPTHGTPRSLAHSSEEDKYSNTSSGRPAATEATASEITAPPHSSPALLTEDKIRAFLHDYYEDYDALRNKQGFGAWSCFAEQYYRPNFQYVRPSGNPIGVDDLVEGLAADMRIKSIQMVSVDSITILVSSQSAVVVYTCDHSFEYKGIPTEDRSVMTCVLELVDGAIKIVHEHRSSGKPIPKETRWQSE